MLVCARINICSNICIVVVVAVVVVMVVEVADVLVAGALVVVVVATHPSSFITTIYMYAILLTSKPIYIPLYPYQWAFCVQYHSSGIRIIMVVQN